MSLLTLSLLIIAAVQGPSTADNVRGSLSISRQVYCRGDVKGDFLQLFVRIRLHNMTGRPLVVPPRVSVGRVIVSDVDGAKDPASLLFSMTPESLSSDNPDPSTYNVLPAGKTVTFQTSTVVPVTRSTTTHDVLGPGRHWLMLEVSPPVRSSLGGHYENLARKGDVWTSPVRVGGTSFQVDPRYTVKDCK